MTMNHPGVLIRGPEWLEFVAQAEALETSSSSGSKNRDDGSSTCSNLSGLTCFNTTNMMTLGESVLHVLGIDMDGAMKNLQHENDVRYHEQQEDAAIATNKRVLPIRQRTNRTRTSKLNTRSNMQNASGSKSKECHAAIAEDYLLQNKKAISTLRVTLQDKEKFKRFTQEVKAHVLCRQTKTRLQEIANDDEEFRQFQHVLRQTKMMTAHAATQCVFASSYENL